MAEISLDLDALDFTKGAGTVTVVCQDAATGVVLMVAHADREALEHTLRTGEMHYRSRSRGLWHKGATSGNVQRVVSLHPDCDGDAVLARVDSAGPACHTGSGSCFAGAASDANAIGRLAMTIARRAAAPVAGSYTNRLLDDRNLRLKKLGEESGELIVACADNDRIRVIEEASDLIYHTLVALTAAGVAFEDVQRTLAGRAKKQAPGDNRTATPRTEGRGN